MYLEILTSYWHSFSFSDSAISDTPYSTSRLREHFKLFGGNFFLKKSKSLEKRREYEIEICTVLSISMQPKPKHGILLTTCPLSDFTHSTWILWLRMNYDSAAPFDIHVPTVLHISTCIVSFFYLFILKFCLVCLKSVILSTVPSLC